MTPAERRAAVLELQPLIARLLRNSEATLGRVPSDDELADWRLAGDILDAVVLRLQADEHLARALASTGYPRDWPGP
jgi:hypothetical protein